jgi:2-keto-3-deoxy-L-rhamnonate aldolase RhmA
MSELTGLRKRLHEPGPLFWSIAVVPEPAIVSILGHSGVDYVMLDVEHAPYTLASLHACVTALKLTPAKVIVRTGSAEKIELQQMADLGVDGVLAPHVETAEAAAEVVSAVRFPPEGGRGIGEGTLATRYGLDEDTYVGTSNAGIAAMVIVESARGVENAAEIAAVPGLDAIFVGAADLSGDIGVPGQYQHPSVLEAMDRVVEQAVAAGLKVFGLSAPRNDAEREAGLVYCATDAIALTAAAASALEQARGAWNGGAA